MENKAFTLSLIHSCVPSEILDFHIKRSFDLMEETISYTNDWDMESCIRKYKLPCAKGNVSPNGDGEWVFQYARMEYLHSLTLASATTERNKCVELFERYVTRFFELNTPKNDAPRTLPEGKLQKKIFYLKECIRNLISNRYHRFSTYRTLDAAIRSYSLLVDIQYFEEYLTSKENFEKYINRDIEYAIGKLGSFEERSNWGIIITALSFTSSLILGRTELIKYAEDKLVHYLNVQIKEDGGHIENSFMYHMNILICLLRLIYWSRKKEYSIHPKIVDTAKLMSVYTNKLADSTFNQIQYGDSDQTSVYTPLFIANYLLNLNIQLPVGRHDFVLLLEFPEVLILANEIVSKPQDNKKLNEVLDHGIWIYKHFPFEIWAFNESNIGGHNHADNGEIVLHYHQIPVLIDCGRYTYENFSKRVYYRSPYAHNVAIVDNALGWEIHGKNRFADIPIPIETKLTCIDGLDACICRYRFHKAQEELSRLFVVIKDHTIVIKTEVCIAGTHTLKTIWNLSKHCHLTSTDKGFLINSNNELLYFSHSGHIASVKNTFASNHYNEEFEIEQITIQKSFEDKGQMYVVISNKRHTLQNKNKDYFEIVYEDSRIVLHF